MVFSEELVAMGTARSSSKPLHNFTLPYLKWGHQRHLRCLKVDESTPAVYHRPRRRSREFEFDDMGRRKETVLLKSNSGGGGEEEQQQEEEGIDAVRVKIMNDLRMVADKMKDKILREEVYEEERMEDTQVEAAAAAAAAAVEAAEGRPWNLRTRRAACKDPNKGFKIVEKKPNSSLDNTEVGAKFPRLFQGEQEIKKEWPKFAVNLTRKEIEEDFMEMVSHRPPRRPKKRPRIVQKQLDSLFPGLWLTEVTIDSYKVPELAENGKSADTSVGTELLNTIYLHSCYFIDYCDSLYIDRQLPAALQLVLLRLLFFDHYSWKRQNFICSTLSWLPWNKLVIGTSGVLDSMVILSCLQSHSGRPIIVEP